MPNKPDTAREDHAKNIVGVASHVVTNSLLQGHSDSNANFVFSPLGFSSILAILKEGARGDTAKEIQNVLNFGAASLDEIRSSYEGALKHLSESNAQMSPQFKTWFYIYKNNTVEEKFTKVIEKYYSVDVKEIKRFDFNDDDTNEKDETEFTYPTTDPYEGLEFPDEMAKKEVLSEQNTDLTDTFKKLKQAIEKAEQNNQNENKIIEEEKESSKFDRNIEDKQYEEVSKIRETMKEEAKEKETEEKIEQETVTETVTDSPATEVMEKETEMPQIEVEALKPENDAEIMQAAESHPIKKRIRAFIEDDVASALSGNSIVAKKDDEDEEEESKMLLFNGLYFRGNWMLPFQQLRATPADVFYNSSSEKTQVTMMRTRGIFRTAYLKSIEATAVEIPYENERYALLVLMPKSHNGINALIKQYQLNTLETIDRELREEHVHLALPKFRVETTGRAEKPLAKSGITSLFTRKADLSGISTEQKLHVDELVQHVAVRVDEGAITQNAFTNSSNTLKPTLNFRFKNAYKMGLTQELAAPSH
uniref:CSON009137 protein n=1 Tax=Culicoides sonorensis TaxID=179676 RepID=A0A336MXJ4_CULSO